MAILMQQPATLDPTVPVGPQLLRVLRMAIVSNELEPGARLSEAEIGARCGVSRQPVREAFIKLAEDGLVEVRPQRGTFVRKINIGAVLDARFVREAVEADIVAACAERADPALVNELKKQIEVQREKAPSDPRGFIEMDDLFHRTLADGAGHSNAWGVVDGMKSQMDRVRQLTATRLPTDHLIKQHEAIVQAIAMNDPAAAKLALRAHLKMILADLPAIQEACPQYFEPRATA